MILFFDMVGGEYDGNSVNGPLGGSELAQVQLAEALATRGHDVAVITAKQARGYPPLEINGVRYDRSINARDVDTIILARMTELPHGIDTSYTTKVIVSLTDQGPHDIAPCHTLVGVSSWQINRFAALQIGAKRKVIPPIIEPAPVLDKIPGRYVYAGAAMKGLDETLQGWIDAGEPGSLTVCHGGWGMASEKQQFAMAVLGVEYLGNLSPARVREEIAKAEFFLGARTYPETFCAVAAVAETCKTQVIMWSPHGKTGLDEATWGAIHYHRESWIAEIKNPALFGERPQQFDRFSADKIARQWEKIL